MVTAPVLSRERSWQDVSHDLHGEVPGGSINGRPILAQSGGQGIPQHSVSPRGQPPFAIRGPSGSAILSELRAEPVATNAADDESLLGIAQQLPCPVHRAPVNKLQSLVASRCGVDVKAEISIVSSAARSMCVKGAVHILELGPKR